MRFISATTDPAATTRATELLTARITSRRLNRGLTKASHLNPSGLAGPKSPQRLPQLLTQHGRWRQFSSSDQNAILKVVQVNDPAGRERLRNSRHSFLPSASRWRHQIENCDAIGFEPPPDQVRHHAPTDVRLHHVSGVRHGQVVHQQIKLPRLLFQPVNRIRPLPLHTLHPLRTMAAEQIVARLIQVHGGERNGHSQAMQGSEHPAAGKTQHPEVTRRAQNGHHRGQHIKDAVRRPRRRP